MKKVLTIILIALLSCGLIASVAWAEDDSEKTILDDLAQGVDAADYKEGEAIQNAADQKASDDAAAQAEYQARAQTGDENKHPRKPGGIPVLPPGAEAVVMTIYVFFASIGAGFVFLSLIVASYRNIASAANPAIRANAILSIQRCIIAVMLICIIPFATSIMIEVNDAMVGAMRDMYSNQFKLEERDTSFVEDINVISELLANVPQTVINLCEIFFDLHPLQNVIFGTDISGGIDVNRIYETETGDAFADALIDFSFIIFEVYFNVYYYLRAWMFAGLLCVAPLLVWLWAVSGRAEVLTTWLITIINKIFIQTFHAFSFLMVFAVLGGYYSPQPTAAPVIQAMTKLCLLLCNIAGPIAAGIIIYLGAKIMFATDDRTAAEAKSGLAKVLVALGIICLSWGIAAVVGSQTYPISDLNIATGSAGDGVGLVATLIGLAAVIGIGNAAMALMTQVVQERSINDTGMETKRMLGMAGGIALTAYSTANRMVSWGHQRGQDTLKAIDRAERRAGKSGAAGEEGSAIYGSLHNTAAPHEQPSQAASPGTKYTAAAYKVGQSLSSQNPTATVPPAQATNAAAPRTPGAAGTPGVSGTTTNNHPGVASQGSNRQNHASPSQGHQPSAGSSPQAPRHQPAAGNSPARQVYNAPQPQSGAIPLGGGASPFSPFAGQHDSAANKPLHRYRPTGQGRRQETIDDMNRRND